MFFVKSFLIVEMVWSCFPAVLLLYIYTDDFYMHSKNVILPIYSVYQTINSVCRGFMFFFPIKYYMIVSSCRQKWTGGVLRRRRSFKDENWHCRYHSSVRLVYHNMIIWKRRSARTAERKTSCGDDRCRWWTTRNRFDFRAYKICDIICIIIIISALLPCAATRKSSTTNAAAPQLQNLSSLSLTHTHTLTHYIYMSIHIMGMILVKPRRADEGNSL